MIFDDLSQIQAVEISRGIYGTKTCFMVVTTLFFSSKIEGFLYVSQKSTHVSKHTWWCTILRHVFLCIGASVAITLIKRNCGTKKESPFQDYLNKGNFINLAPEVIVKKVVENRYCQ